MSDGIEVERFIEAKPRKVSIPVYAIVIGIVQNAYTTQRGGQNKRFAETKERKERK